MTRTSATMSKVWTQLPVLGDLGITVLPKKPSSHKMISITTIIHNMSFSPFLPSYFSLAVS